MNSAILYENIKTLFTPGKGFLAIDESSGSIKKRFDAVGIEDSEETRRQYRQWLITADSISDYVSAMILYDETMFQKDDHGIPFPQVLKRNNMETIVKVDTGRKPLPFHPGEKMVQGLDNLQERLTHYKNHGAIGAKFRSEIWIGDNLPSKTCLYVNHHAMARYAAICQDMDILPIVEPEVLIKGSHSLERSAEVLESTLKALFAELPRHGVDLKAVILKTSMAVPGNGCSDQSDDDTIAKTTSDILKRSIPNELGGVVFLSGGQSPEQATERLRRIAQLGPYPWPLTFSFARAIQGPALEIWAQNLKAIEKAQKTLVHYAKMNSQASLGK